MDFAKALILTLIAVFGFLYLVNNYYTIDHFLEFSLITVAVFTAFSFLIYMLSFKLQRLENKMPFMNLIIINMMMKFVIAGALVFWYYFTYNPESGTFVIPFLVVYVCFTIFETYFLDKIARS